MRVPRPAPPLPSRILRALLIGAVLLMAAFLIAGSVAELSASAQRPPPAFGAKALHGGDVVRIRGRVVPRTSRYEGDGAACTHRFALDTDKSRFDVEYPACWFPEGFHRQTHLEVIVTGRRRGEALAAAQVEPQLGGCCGGPHCYPEPRSD